MVGAVAAAPPTTANGNHGAGAAGQASASSVRCDRTCKIVTWAVAVPVFVKFSAGGASVICVCEGMCGWEEGGEGDCG